MVKVGGLIGATLVLLSACASAERVSGPEQGDRLPVQGPPGSQLGTAQVVTLANEWNTGIDDRRRDVIRSAQTWAALWTDVYSTRSPAPSLPAVDFGNSMVIAASMGTRASGGFAIRIDAVHRVGAGYGVVVRETSPGPTCGVTAALTAPVVVVRVPAVSGAVLFEEIKDVHSCS